MSILGWVIITLVVLMIVIICVGVYMAFGIDVCPHGVDIKYLCRWCDLDEEEIMHD